MRNQNLADILVSDGPTWTVTLRSAGQLFCTRHTGASFKGFM